jgi:hypothetical protein
MDFPTGASTRLWDRLGSDDPTSSAERLWKPLGDFLNAVWAVMGR